MAEQKPKRVLNEAQRLAFLKGREKRMANIEKKRLEKLEAEQMEFKKEFVPPIPSEPETPKIVKPKTKKSIPVVPPEIPNPPPDAIPKEEIPEMPKLERQTNETPNLAVPTIDEEKIAAKVAEQVLRKIEESKPKRKPREPKSAPVVETEKTVNSFSWL